jgi:hypothetical protein
MVLREMSKWKDDEDSVMDDERVGTAEQHMAIRPRGRNHGNWADQHEAWFQHGEYQLGVWFL